MTIVTNRFVPLCQTLPGAQLSPNNFLITDQEKVKLIENYQLGGVSNLERERRSEISHSIALSLYLTGK